MRQTRLTDWIEGWTPRSKISFDEELERALPLGNQYRKVKIPKKGGGWREIFIPAPELKKVQRKILRYLRKIWKVQIWKAGVYGLSPGGSYTLHAKCHADSRYHFKFDLKDAFPSVNVAKLREILYQAILGESGDEKIAQKRSELIIKLTTFEGKLPQGAPTSPFLFYMMLTAPEGLFWRLERICSRWRISCYVDGFVVSGPTPIPVDIQEKMFKIVEECGFSINPKKTRFQDCRQGAVMITGIRVDGKGRIFLPKKTIRHWRGIIGRARFDSNPELQKKIEGFIAFLKSIYQDKLPPQIEKPYLLFKSKQNPPGKFD